MKLAAAPLQILVFGATGQVATELQRFQGVTTLSRNQADLNDSAKCAALIAQSNADVVINAAAYTGVDAAETDTKQAYRVNSETPATMANAAALRNLPFLHISTDYVFDGTGTAPWREDDPTGPLGVYGASKLAGEQGVQTAGGPYVILRTSWVISAHGNNFVKTMLRLGAQRDQLNIVADQIGGPTCAGDIASTLVQIAERLCQDTSKSGVYHFAGSPDVSWAALAREVFAQSSMTCRVNDIPTTEYPTPAERPLNSRLECSKLDTVFGISRPDWRIGLAGILSDLKAG